MLLHVSQGVLVGVDENEEVIVEVEAAPHVQIQRREVLRELGPEAWLVGLLDAPSLEELASDDAY